MLQTFVRWPEFFSIAIAQSRKMAACKWLAVKHYDFHKTNVWKGGGGNRPTVNGTLFRKILSNR